MAADRITEETARLARRAELLAHFGAEALRSIPLPRLLDIAVEATRKGVDTEHVKVLQPDPDGATWQTYVDWSLLPQ